MSFVVGLLKGIRDVRCRNADVDTGIIVAASHAPFKFQCEVGELLLDVPIEAIGIEGL